MENEEEENIVEETARKIQETADRLEANVWNGIELIQSNGYEIPVESITQEDGTYEELDENPQRNYAKESPEEKILTELKESTNRLATSISKNIRIIDNE